MRLDGWLFLRGQESIWVVRTHPLSMVVAGPGPRREERHFIDEATLNAYQITLGERLAGDGWLLWSNPDDRRSGRDRRAVTRGTDRRAPAPRGAGRLS